MLEKSYQNLPTSPDITNDLAETGGLVTEKFCAPSKQFQLAIAAADGCATDSDQEGGETNFSKLQEALDYCAENYKEPIIYTTTATTGNTTLTVVATLEYSSIYDEYYGTVTSMNAALESENSALRASVSVASAGFSSNVLANSTTLTDSDSAAATATSPSSESANDGENGRSSSTAAIAGSVVGGVLFLVTCFTIIFLIRCRRRRHLQRNNIDGPASDHHEKPQLHSDDIKPEREELTGSLAPNLMLEKQGAYSELPANEEVATSRGLASEMPANESVAGEMETTENEMRTLDRLLAGSTQVSFASDARVETQVSGVSQESRSGE